MRVHITSEGGNAPKPVCVHMLCTQVLLKPRLCLATRMHMRFDDAYVCMFSIRVSLKIEHRREQ
jgi:hypothetical protein